MKMSSYNLTKLMLSEKIIRQKEECAAKVYPQDQVCYKINNRHVRVLLAHKGFR